MNRTISTKTHGMIDYTWASAAGSLPSMMGHATETARLIRNVGAASTANAIVTNYEAGLMKIMPMKAHLAFDFIMFGALVLSPLFLPASERRYAAFPMALGALGLLTTLLTETESPAERRQAFTPSRELSEAVADPDVAHSPHLRTHLE